MSKNETLEHLAVAIQYANSLIATKKDIKEVCHNLMDFKSQLHDKGIKSDSVLMTSFNNIIDKLINILDK